MTLVLKTDTPKIKAQKVLAVAKKFVDDGYVEVGDNHTIMGKWYGLDGQPWCAMFVSYCFAQTGQVKLVAATSPTKGFASVNAGLAWFKKNGQTVPIEQAQPGDIIFYDFDHTGILYLNDLKKKQVIVFEGNTSPEHLTTASQNNGGGAYKRIRDYSLVAGVGRPKW